MKKTAILILSTLALFFLFSCETNKKLNQENAERPLYRLLSSFSGCEGSLVIKSIDAVNQFSENEASTIVHAEFTNPHVNWNWDFNCIYKRNIEKKWVLTSINVGVMDKRDGSSCQSDFCDQFQNVNEIVQ